MEPSARSNKGKEMFFLKVTTLDNAGVFAPGKLIWYSFEVGHGPQFVIVL